eukprot:maker-scaffold_62-snap-gene-0.4-mRNA-1 protein AED:0.00 eAED:0.00 QI:933/1/1/1/1/1/3/107/147
MKKKEWDSTLSDLSKLKLNEGEIILKKVLRTSRYDENAHKKLNEMGIDENLKEQVLSTIYPDEDILKRENSEKKKLKKLLRDLEENISQYEKAALLPPVETGGLQNGSEEEFLPTKEAVKLLVRCCRNLAHAEERIANLEKKIQRRK